MSVTTDIHINITWQDGYNIDGVRPSALKIQIYDISQGVSVNPPQIGEDILLGVPNEEFLSNLVLENFSFNDITDISDIDFNNAYEFRFLPGTGSWNEEFPDNFTGITWSSNAISNDENTYVLSYKNFYVQENEDNFNSDNVPLNLDCVFGYLPKNYKIEQHIEINWEDNNSTLKNDKSYNLIIVKQTEGGLQEDVTEEYTNGESYFTLNEENEWKKTFILPKYENSYLQHPSFFGQQIDYFILEYSKRALLEENINIDEISLSPIERYTTTINYIVEQPQNDNTNWIWDDEENNQTIHYIKRIIEIVNILSLGDTWINKILYMDSNNSNLDTATEIFLGTTFDKVRYSETNNYSLVDFVNEIRAFFRSDMFMKYSEQEPSNSNVKEWYEIVKDNTENDLENDNP